MVKIPPLAFIVPGAFEKTVEISGFRPALQTLILPLSKCICQEWGVKKENYILQQFYNTLGLTLVLLTISSKQYQVLKVKCARPIAALQYTLQGYTFTKLSGFGCLPLFEGTYTVQYISEGEHYILLEPGNYQYLYIVPNEGLDLLFSNHDAIQQLSAYLDTSHCCGKLATRLPILTETKKLIQNLLSPMPTDKSQHFYLSSKLLELIGHFHQQLLSAYPASYTHDNLFSYINTFLADNIEMPVPDIIKDIKHRFYWGTSTLRKTWMLAGAKTNSSNSVLPPRFFATQLRLKLALYLLIIEHLPVTNVANRLGFYDVAAFRRQFYNRYKNNPSKTEAFVNI